MSAALTQKQQPAIAGLRRFWPFQQKSNQPVPRGRSPWRTIFESFGGAWQSNVEESRADLWTYPTLYACVFRIASDIGKLPFTLARRDGATLTPVHMSELDALLTRPNDFQTAGQFREAWMLSKLTAGNTYVLKERAGRAVRALYVLDPERVTPLVSDTGAVFYQIDSERLARRFGDAPNGQIVIPASEIIHDRTMALHHQLVGVPPLAAAYWPALKNMKILRNATEFFANSANPGGLLTAPAGMDQKDVDEVQAYWDKNFTGGKAGRVAVIGADMKFHPFAMKSIDAQMIEQMRYSDEQICQPFGIPPFKVGIGAIPSGLGVDGVNQMYYQDALQPHIEHMEALLSAGLDVTEPLTITMDIEPLIRMDEGKRAEVEVALVRGMVKTPDEGRARFGLAPIEGGDTLWGQAQDYPLGLLADRTSWDPDFKDAGAPPEPTEEVRKLGTDDAIRAMRPRATEIARRAMMEKTNGL